MAGAFCAYKRMPTRRRVATVPPNHRFPDSENAVTETGLCWPTLSFAPTIRACRSSAVIARRLEPSITFAIALNGTGVGDRQGDGMEFPIETPLSRTGRVTTRVTPQEGIRSTKPSLSVSTGLTFVRESTTTRIGTSGTSQWY